MNELKSTLISMCGYLASVQSEDGGFSCEACGFEHGRADNAVFPFLCTYSLTGDPVWLTRAEKLLDFREKLENEDGSVANDFESPWKGITVFSAIGLYKSLSYFGQLIPSALYERIKERFIRSAKWVHENVRPGFRANVNYYCAAAAVNAMYGKTFSDGAYLESAVSLLSYCMNLFTENGILRGEGQPHGFSTPSGCVPADIGYIAGESIPCLTDAASVLGDTQTLRLLADYSAGLLEFMLPDGAWDNSFGSRNNKWTYYGSRTSTGCTGAFFALSRFRPELAAAAMRSLSLISGCSEGGALYGGPEYFLHRQKPCVHHTFSHASGIADAVASGAVCVPCSLSLPCDRPQNRILFFKEINTYKIYCGNWIATVTGNDYSTYTKANGASHASGGTLSMLYHRVRGPVIAGAVSEYKRTETNNMQIPSGSVPHRTLLPGLSITAGGKYFSTAQCFTPDITVSENTGEKYAFSVLVKTRPETSEGEPLPGADYSCFEYRFSETEVRITSHGVSAPGEARYVLPVISRSGASVRGEYSGREKIFFLTPGFGADEYSFPAENVDITIT